MRRLIVPALFACVIGLDAAQPAAPADTRVPVIVVLADQPIATVSIEEPVVVAAGLSPVEADRMRALREARLLGRVEALARPSRVRVASAVNALGGEVIYAGRAINALSVMVPAEAVAALRARPDVASVELDVPRMRHIDVVPTALKVQAFWNAGFLGGATDVAVIDTGIYRDHEAFVARRHDVRWGTTPQGAPRAFHSTAFAYAGSAYCDNPNDPDDYHGHGTLAAGVVFSQRSDRRGVAYGIDRLYNLKAGFNTCSGGGSSYMTDTMEAVDWALATDDPPEVFNYSYGGQTSSDDDSFSRFWDAIVDGYGKVVTISAGNSGPGAGTVGSPGIAHNVITVANVDDRNTTSRADDVIASSSSRGPTVRARKKPDLAAPGTNVILPSTWGANRWASATGTSFSAPAVAAVAALLVDAGVADPRAIKALLVNSADDYGTPGWDAAFGWGYVNAERAFNERAQVSLVTVGAPGTATSTRYFERTASASTKVSLAWNRRVSYTAGGWPGSAGDANNLDLFLYSAVTGALAAWSTSSIDNVEQVVSSTNEPAVLVLRSATPFSGAIETAALAHSGGFVARTGPSLTTSLAAPGTVAPSAVFTVTATITNTGDLPNQSHTATLTVPPGFTVTEGSASRSVGRIDAGGQATVTWNVSAPSMVMSAVNLGLQVSSSSYGSVWQASASTAVAVVSACTYAVSPTSVSVPHEATSTTLAVTAGSGCAWTTTSGSWVRPAPAGGVGSGTVTLEVDAHAGFLSRSASLTIAGVAVSVTQQGRPAENARDYYLAEGATGILTLDIAIANPNPVTMPVRVTFLREPPRLPYVFDFDLGPTARRTVRANDIPELAAEALSTIVTSLSGEPLVVERTMFWGAGHYGGHSGSAVERPETRWYFAEGSQGFFDTYVLLANPGDAPAVATVRFLREHAGEVVVTRAVNPRSRETIIVGDIAALRDTSFAIVVDATAPIVAERAMYWSTPDQWWAGGHESAGVPALSTSWSFAEGATGPYFDAFLLVGNPNTVPADVIFTYLLPSGLPVVVARTIPPNRRLTVLVDEVDSRLADTAFSATIISNVPVVAERAMYWPGHGWREGHNGFGMTETATRWGVADGRVGQAGLFETFVLVANPHPTHAALVRLTFLREAGRPPVQHEFSVGPAARHTVRLTSDTFWNAVPALAHESFGVLVESVNGVAIAVERATYWNAGAEVWAGGASATGSRLP